MTDDNQRSAHRWDWESKMCAEPEAYQPWFGLYAKVVGVVVFFAFVIWLYTVVAPWGGKP